jgi:hypothetical protein
MKRGRRMRTASPRGSHCGHRSRARDIKTRMQSNPGPSANSPGKESEDETFATLFHLVTKHYKRKSAQSSSNLSGKMRDGCNWP